MYNGIGISQLLKQVKLQLILFFYALSYFTRLPIPACIIFDNKQFHKANAYLPVIGLLNASLMIAFFSLCQLLFSIPVSIILMLICALLLTGALHEDGFADCCDGLGGGYNVTQRLKIMKDSQIGTYGGIALILLFLLKFNLLVELAETGIATLASSLLVAHTLSRYASLYIMQILPYVRLESTGKVKVLATKLNSDYFIFASLTACCCLLFLTLSSALMVVTATAIFILLINKLLIRNLDGYTGDCLGFIQQSVEITILLLLTAVLST